MDLANRVASIKLVEDDYIAHPAIQLISSQLSSRYEESENCLAWLTHKNAIGYHTSPGDTNIKDPVTYISACSSGFMCVLYYALTGALPKWRIKNTAMGDVDHRIAMPRLQQLRDEVSSGGMHRQ